MATHDAAEEAKRNATSRRDAPVRRMVGGQGEGELCREEKSSRRRTRPTTGGPDASSSSSSRVVLEPSLLPCHWRVDRVKDEEEKEGEKIEAAREQGGLL